MSANQLNPVATDIVAFDTEDFAGGDLSRSGNTITGLQLGHVYLIVCDAHIFGVTGFMQLQAYDVASAAALKTWIVRMAGYSTNAAGGQMLSFIYAPPADTSIRIEVVSLTAGMDVYADQNGKSYFSVLDLGVK